MTSQPDYLRYLASAKQAEMAERLRDQGFTVALEERVGDVQFDLVARKDRKGTAYEFKSGRSPRSSPKGMERLQAAATEAGLDLRVVVVNPPPRVEVKIEHLTEMLFDFIVHQAFPQELDRLSAHTVVDGLSDVEVSRVHVGDGIRVEGVGTLDVTLQYGSGSGHGVRGHDGFPFTFALLLGADGRLQRVETLQVDTSAFYE